MTKLDEMWAALTAYQPQAHAAGHGESWAKMCSEKTYAAARTAYGDAYVAAAYVAYAAAYAAYAAAYADADAKKWAQIAIDRINKILANHIEDNLNMVAQQALDKKAENARELGLDYEPDGMHHNKRMKSGGML